jgi:hypothetical protein
VLSLQIQPVADLLGQAVPPLPGLLVALAAAPVILLVDALDKRARARQGTAW